MTPPHVHFIRRKKNAKSHGDLLEVPELHGPVLVDGRSDVLAVVAVLHLLHLPVARHVGQSGLDLRHVWYLAECRDAVPLSSSQSSSPPSSPSPSLPSTRPPSPLSMKPFPSPWPVQPRGWTFSKEATSHWVRPRNSWGRPRPDCWRRRRISSELPWLSLCRLWMGFELIIIINWNVN